MIYMRVLAVDPGYERCGVAVLERRDGQEELIFSDCLQTSKELDFPDRLVRIGEALVLIIKEYTPIAFAIETLYFNTNQKTAMRVAEVRGMLLYVAMSHGLSVHEYSPSQIKTAVTSWGRASKKDVIEMVPRLIVIKKDIRLDDEYDAIAVGLTHLAHKG